MTRKKLLILESGDNFFRSDDAMVTVLRDKMNFGTQTVKMGHGEVGRDDLGSERCDVHSYVGTAGGDEDHGQGFAGPGSKWRDSNFDLDVCRD
jgi:hypothetical protein